MKLNVYSVFDSKVGAYLQPFFMQTDAEATRAIVDLVRDANHQFSQHPTDFSLFRHGTFDNVSGLFEPLKAPESIISCTEIRVAEIDHQAEVSKTASTG